MKERSKYFLSNKRVNHSSESFDYIKELHDYLWRFVRVAVPGASGSLNDYVDMAIERLEEKE